MTEDPTLVSRDALKGTRVALSVSGSADLRRLGLTASHLELLVAEITRAVVLAGGTIVYGGRLRPDGFTQVIMEEVHRYSDQRQALEIYVPLSEYRDIPLADLKQIDTRLGMSGTLKLVSGEGEPRSIRELADRLNSDSASDVNALTSMRRLVSRIADARIVVGGKLTDFAGTEPGVIEEARMTLEESRRLYVAGGYGGAGAAIAHALVSDDFSWAPPGIFEGLDSAAVQAALDSLKVAYVSSQIDDGLDSNERKILAVSHRPANIATLLVLGLARVNEERAAADDIALP